MTGDEPEWMNATQVARMLRIPKGAWLSIVAVGKAPEPKQIKRPGPKCLRWNRDEVMLWQWATINRMGEKLAGDQARPINTLALPN